MKLTVLHSSKKNPEILDFSLLETFSKKVKENCAPSLPWEGDYKISMVTVQP
jgi:hypothetical protein